jgi:uncharacterized protein YeaO (DUF488 family)
MAPTVEEKRLMAVPQQVESKESDAIRINREKLLTILHWRMGYHELRENSNPLGTVQMTIRLKRWNDPAEKADGLRVLICRYRPRGLRKADETWDIWCKELGPSPELLAAFHGKHGAPISWSEYRKRYLTEMKGQRERIAELAERVAEGETVTLLCSSSCNDESRCHRSLLRELIEKSAAKRNG